MILEKTKALQSFSLSTGVMQKYAEDHGIGNH